MKKSSLLILLLLLGCQTVEKVSVLDTTTTTSKKEIIIDQEIMKDCMDLKSLSYPTTFEDILAIYADNIQLYVDCKKQNAGKKKLLQDYVESK